MANRRLEPSRLAVFAVATTLALAAACGSGENRNRRNAAADMGSDSGTDGGGAPLTGGCSSDGWCWSGVGITTSTLNAVWGSASNDVWVVGGKLAPAPAPGSNTILYWSGSSWSDMSVASVNGPLYGVWGSSATDVWAVGQNGLTIHWDGTAWASVAGATPFDIHGIFGFASDDVWAVGPPGYLLHWDAINWGALPNGFSTGLLYGIWGVASNDVWAVGDAGSILHWDGTAWTPFNSDTNQSLRAVWGSASNDVWAVGPNGVATHWNGIGWASVPGFGNGIWGFGKDDVWAVGSGGLGVGEVFTPMGTGILNWNSLWLNSNSGTSQTFQAVWGAAYNDIWAVGVNGMILHHSDATLPSDGGTTDATSSDDGGTIDATLPGDGGADATGADADGGAPDAALPDGCVTPYTPGFVACTPIGECNLEYQFCCPGFSCEQGLCLAHTAYNCDGPEDCPPGQVCAGGTPAYYCTSSASACLTPATISDRNSSSCACHSSADCPPSFPYCYPSVSAGYGIANCQAVPPPADAGIVYGSCSPPAPPPDYQVDYNGAICTAPDEYCTGVGCQPQTSACSGFAVKCDGPEDCLSGQSCCVNGSATFCSGGCTSSSPKQVVCHTVADCPSGFTACVPTPSGTFGWPFSFCQ